MVWKVEQRAFGNANRESLQADDDKMKSRLQPAEFFSEREKRALFLVAAKHCTELCASFVKGRSG
jgi:hypothetical protein